MTGAPLPAERSRLLRILQVTALLAGTGAIVGAAIAVVPLALILAWDRGVGAVLREAVFFLIPGTVGALVGLVLGPIVAWGLLRRVPLWKAVLYTAIGTLAGFLAAFLFASRFFFVLPIAGFLVTALLLWWRHRSVPLPLSRSAS